MIRLFYLTLMCSTKKGRPSALGSGKHWFSYDSDGVWYLFFSLSFGWRVQYLMNTFDHFYVTSSSGLCVMFPDYVYWRSLFIVDENDPGWDLEFVPKSRCVGWHPVSNFCPTILITITILYIHWELFYKWCAVPSASLTMQVIVYTSSSSTCYLMNISCRLPKYSWIKSVVFIIGRTSRQSKIAIMYDSYIERL